MDPSWALGPDHPSYRLVSCTEVFFRSVANPLQLSYRSRAANRLLTLGRVFAAIELVICDMLKAFFRFDDLIGRILVSNREWAKVVLDVGLILATIYFCI